MYPLYMDIRERLGTPLWIDSDGVPRYSEFNPHDACKVYGDVVLLLEVQCQSCEKRFKCATTYSVMDIIKDTRGVKDATEQFKAFKENPIDYAFGWGDAPWHTHNGDESSRSGQCSGTTMSTDYICLEYWVKENSEWVKKEVPDQYTRWE